jgi:hypothetical protein
MTRSFKFKKNSLISLIALAILLIGSNIILNNIYSSHNERVTEFNEEDVSKRFKNIMSSFGIESGLVKEKSFIDSKTNRETFSFKVQVPRDLSIPEVLQEVYKSFRKDSLTINSVEKVKGGKTNITLKSGTTIILNAEFDYSKNYFRNLGAIAFIIYDVDPMKPETISLIESPTKLNFLIRPETKYLQSLEIFSSNLQQFSILIDDEISEQKYQLGPGFSEQRIINVVKTLVTDFPKAVCFIVDDGSDFYKSTNYEAFKMELVKRNIKLFKFSDFVSFDFSENISFVFNEKINSLEKGESIIFFLNEQSYLALRIDIMKFQMKGYRVITSSLIL